MYTILAKTVLVALILAIPFKIINFLWSDRLLQKAAYHTYTIDSSEINKLLYFSESKMKLNRFNKLQLNEYNPDFDYTRIFALINYVHFQMYENNLNIADSSLEIFEIPGYVTLYSRVVDKNRLPSIFSKNEK